MARSEATFLHLLASVAEYIIVREREEKSGIVLLFAMIREHFYK